MIVEAIEICLSIGIWFQTLKDMINHIDEHNTGILDFPAFYNLVKKKSCDQVTGKMLQNFEIHRFQDPENHFKDAFRAFSKDSGGEGAKCQPQSAYYICPLDHMWIITFFANKFQVI